MAELLAQFRKLTAVVKAWTVCVQAPVLILGALLAWHTTDHEAVEFFVFVFVGVGNKKKSEMWITGIQLFRFSCDDWLATSEAYVDFY